MHKCYELGLHAQEILLMGMQSKKCFRTTGFTGLSNCKRNRGSFAVTSRVGGDGEVEQEITLDDTGDFPHRTWWARSSIQGLTAKGNS